MKSNQRFILKSFLIAAVAAAFCACDDAVVINDFAALCAQSGGKYQDEKCTCKNGPCPDGVICNVDTKQCAYDKPISPDDKPCSRGETICLNVSDGGALHGMKRECIENGTDEDGNPKYKWGELTPCNADSNSNRRTLCDGNACAKCAENDVTCVKVGEPSNGGDRRWERQQCTEGKWEPIEKCEYGCADNYKCAPKCDVNKCVDAEGENGQLYGKMTECVDNRANTYSCEDKDKNVISCNAAGSGCGECLNGNKECKDGKLTECKLGKWEPVPCPDGVSCSHKKKACGACKNNEKICELIEGASYLSTCVDGEWNKEQCPNDEFCQNNSCAECINSRCVGDNFQPCVLGRWMDVQDCGTGICKKGDNGDLGCHPRSN